MTAETRGLAVIQPTQMQTVPQYSAAPAINWLEVEDLVNRVYYKGLTIEQRTVLMAWCKRFQLDPLAQDIVPIAGRPFVTLAGLIRVADRSGHYDGCTATSEMLTEGPYAGKYIATATVWRNDRHHPTVMQARQWEHERLKQPGKQDGPWDKSPGVMTEKCALARAFRLSFALVGLTAAEEVGYDEESEETNAGKVIIIDQGRPGPAAQALPAPAARVAQARVADQGAPEAGEGAEEPTRYDWTDFWPWARARGLNDRKALDTAVGRSTSGMTPWEIKQALDAPAAPVQSVEDQAQEMLDWLMQEERTPRQVEILLGKLFSLTGDRRQHEMLCLQLFRMVDDQPTLDAYRKAVTPLLHQDDLDGAWHDRMVELGRHTDVVPAVAEDEGQVQTQVQAALDPFDDVPFD